jgi:OOP family OmpA-OmpF porin
MKRLSLILLMLAVSVVQKASAQAGARQEKQKVNNDSVFVSCPVVIFEDNFHSDSLGTFPKHWWIMDRDSAKYKKLCRVRYVNGKKALVIDSIHRDWLKQSLSGEPGPRMHSACYLPNKFTLEYDFLMDRDAAMYLNFYATNFATVFEVMVLDNKHHNSVNTRIKYVIFEGPSDPPLVGVNIDPFNYARWHHLAVSYEARRATVYLDGKKEFTTPAVDRDPLKFLLGYDGNDTIAYTNFRLATDSNAEKTNFNHLLTENTFTTHAILFDVNKAEIKTESTGFVKQLAEWLKANPTVNLEIDGHTDNDGKATDNMKLSKDRAEAVKNQLMLFGIKSNRLTTKGFGATRPIRPNTTPEGRAENRRVVFIKK